MTALDTCAKIRAGRVRAADITQGELLELVEAVEAAGALQAAYDALAGSAVALTGGDARLVPAEGVRPIVVGSVWRGHRTEMHRRVTDAVGGRVSFHNEDDVEIAADWTESYFRRTHAWVSDPAPLPHATPAEAAEISRDLLPSNRRVAAKVARLDAEERTALANTDAFERRLAALERAACEAGWEGYGWCAP